MQELEDYVSLLNIGDPDFIEIKAVTYCGKSDASSLTMENVPWHKDVCHFAEMIAERAPIYGLAAAHEHSCCVLLAKKDYFIDNQWYTWIDYPKFHELMRVRLQYVSTKLCKDQESWASCCCYCCL